MITLQHTKQEQLSDKKDSLVKFYEEATEDYEFWSKDFNMHFGWFEFGKTNPFKRDEMLNNLNVKIIKNLNLIGDDNNVADLGCGMGGTMRTFKKLYPKSKITGVTLSEFQKTEGNNLLKNYKDASIELQNYNQTTFESETFNGVVAIESFCHSGHSYSSVKEAYRILKPNANLVISDAFLKRPKNQLSTIAKNVYKGICKSWSLEDLGNITDVQNQLQKIGFQKIELKEISWHIAPSVLHVPFAIPAFICKQLWERKNVKPQSWNNLKGSFFALLCGLLRNEFGYYQIIATK